MTRNIRLLTILTAFMVLAIFTVTTSYAEDVMLDGVKVQSVVEKKDKNGNPYTRIIVTEKKSLNGVEYTAGTPIMAFGEAHVAVKTKALKPGDTLKAICSSRLYNGSNSYTLTAIVQ